MTGPASLELPMAGRPRGWDRQRSAAARNREAILDAARGLFAAQGVEATDVRQIAAAAGVGMGTLYRRFPDKAGIVAALIDPHERALQDAVLTGAPSLGPGAAAEARLDAFLQALAALTEAQLPLLRASEGAAPAARFQTGAYRAWHQHVGILLTDLGRGDEARWLADVVMAPFGAALYHHHRHELGLSAAEIATRAQAAARRLAES
ncbi:TetR/AcrR family transcriptional regulator [Svornostia abyssi]|uniref:TetR/AcrR family transcriptional regulator n=1 Tax=Svornostia abyssi TaxID=2898438 RepID=A0ABY5PAX5_9ACTN|nr:TetR/AcrR family transcriptional regulator [Parviterribacteraceae bacterium J379]